MRKYFITINRLIIAAFFLPQSLFAQDQLWQSFTNMRAVKGYYDSGGGFSHLLVSTPQGIWAATAGGLLLWDANRQTFRRFTNIEGLSQNNTRAVGMDRRGRLWIALANGFINIYDPVKNSFSQVEDYRGLQIYDFFAQGDSMYIALNLGVSLYDVARNEVKETYQNLGIRFPRATTVTALYIDGRNLWAATNIGIARTSLDLPNLLAPESWTNYTTQEGLLSATVRGFAKLESSLVAATANGAAAFGGQRWSEVSGNIGARDIVQLITSREGSKTVLYAATPFAVYRAETLGNWTVVDGGFPSAITGIVVDASGTPWASTHDAGLFEFDRTDQSWRSHVPDGPATNNFSSVSLDQDGNVWCTSSTTAFHIYDGTRWYNYSPRNFPIPDNFDGFRYSIHLPNGEHWLATWGRGIYIVEGNLDALTIKAHIDVANGVLSTARCCTNYPVVPFLKQDSEGNIWILNYDAANTNALLAHTPEGRYVHFSASDVLRSREVAVLEIEKTLTNDRIWVGTSDKGVSVLDYMGTVLDKSDDTLRAGLNVEEDNLLSNKVTTLAQDRDGYMWIGTDKGLNYWFAGTVNDRFCYSLINDNVQVVRVDPRNNKWIGTSAGITVLSGEDNCSTTHYTVENSPLVGNSVTSIAFNPNTGDAWIATTTGLSRFRTPFTAPKPDLKQLKGYPNPFLLDEQTGICSSRTGFHITNLAEDSGVRIFNVAGELVRDYPAEQVPGAQICWDGRDASGRLVPSGVYLFVAFVESTGENAVGKVAVVRK
jgi:ligand-binding sensor domain-containing protein